MCRYARCLEYSLSACTLPLKVSHILLIGEPCLFDQFFQRCAQELEGGSHEKWKLWFYCLVGPYIEITIGRKRTKRPNNCRLLYSITLLNVLKLSFSCWYTFQMTLLPSLDQVSVWSNPSKCTMLSPKLCLSRIPRSTCFCLTPKVQIKSRFF